MNVTSGPYTFIEGFYRHEGFVFRVLLQRQARGYKVLARWGAERKAK